VLFHFLFDSLNGRAADPEKHEFLLSALKNAFMLATLSFISSEV